MTIRRRDFLGAGIASIAMAASGGEDRAVPPGDPLPGRMEMNPIGQVSLQGDRKILRILPEFAPALKGLEGYSHVVVLYWFDRNDVPEKRRILQVHPRGNPDNPLTGVFACRSPFRPNLIGLSVCRILAVANGTVTVESIDAFDNTPIVDLKPYIPALDAATAVRLPGWVKS